MEIVEFLTACLDEDERIARRAGDSFRQIGETGVIVATEGDRAEECASANWAGVAEHIVAWDPARVLREIDAKRGIVARYEFARHEAAALDIGEEERKTRIASAAAFQSCAMLLAGTFEDRPGYAEAIASVE